MHVFLIRGIFQQFINVSDVLHARCEQQNRKVERKSHRMRLCRRHKTDLLSMDLPNNSVLNLRCAISRCKKQ